MIIGIDIGKETWEYAIVNGSLELIEKGKIKVKEINAKKLRDFLKEKKIDIIIVEFTGVYTFYLYKLVKQTGLNIKIYYVHSNHSDILRKRFFKSKKSDEIDAYIIAKSYVFKEILIELKVNDLILQLIELVREHKLIKKYLRQAKTLANSDDGLFENKELKDSIKKLEETKKKIEKQIKEIIENSKYKELTKIDGINYISLAYILAEVKDISRFPTVWKFLAYCGVAPVQYSSGSFNVSRTTSRVNKEIKSILRMAALSLIRKEPYKTIYKNKREQGKHHYVALSHIAKRIAKKLYFSLLKLEKNKN